MNKLLSVFIILFIYSCKNEKTRECVCNTQNETCKIYLDTLSVDSITVFTEKYNIHSNTLNFINYFGLDSFRCLSKNEIEECEYLIRDKKTVLQAFLFKYGEEPKKRESWSGYYIYGMFQFIPIVEYKRQYFGVTNSQKNKKILLFLLNSKHTTVNSVIERYSKNEMIDRPTCPEEGDVIIFFTFLIDLNKRTLEIIPL